MRERYLEVHIKPSVQNCHFRRGVSHVNGPQASLLSSRKPKTAPVCVDTNEDGCHVLFECSLNSQLRGKFPLPLYGDLPRKERYCSLCGDFDDNFAERVNIYLLCTYPKGKPNKQLQSVMCEYGSMKSSLFLDMNTCC